MVDERDLVENLKNGVCDIISEIAPGRNDVVKVTLQPGYFQKPLTKVLAEEQVNALDYHDGVQFKALHVWEVVRKDWVSIRLDKILSIQLTQG